MGWSSWCTNDICGIPDLCSEFEVRNKADAMVANGMRDAGYTMMLLDDCWAAHDRDENGELQPMPWAFPTGEQMEKLKSLCLQRFVVMGAIFSYMLLTSHMQG